MRVPDEMLKCVVFVAVKLGTNDKVTTLTYGGTAFFVSCPHPTTSTDAKTTFPYLVTALHVAEANEHRDLMIRMNKRDGTVDWLNIAAGRRWYTHPGDVSVDLALLPGISDEAFDYKAVPVSMFATDEVIKDCEIGPGDEVSVLGLFSHKAGDKKDHPIVRVGNIAMMPEEKIRVQKFGLIDAYLIEARSLGGISGSPVFVRETLNVEVKVRRVGKPDRDAKLAGAGSFFLLGAVHGHWKIPPSAIDSPNIVVDDEAKDKLNIGIAIVVPATKILETLQHPELVEMRKRIMAEKRAVGLPAMDSIVPESDTQSTHGAAIVPVPTHVGFLDDLTKATRRRRAKPSRSGKRKR
jgi:hypothetical protein